MAGFVSVKTDMFFDRQSVIDKLDNKERRVLSRVGSYGRGAVQKSIKKPGKKKAYSDPGTPPRWHVRGSQSLKDRIFFGYDKTDASVVIGPSKFNSTRYARLVGVSTVPELLEKGGARIIRSRFFKGRKLKETKNVRQVYKPRPYVGSSTKAFQNTTAKMRELMGSIPL